MPLSSRFRPVFVALECSVAPVVGVDFGWLHWDTFYDRNIDTIGSLPAGIGFHLNSTYELEFDVAGLFSFVLALQIEPAPGAPATCLFFVPGLIGQDQIEIADPNTLGLITRTRIEPCSVGDTVTLGVGGSGGDIPVTYGVLEVTRLS